MINHTQSARALWNELRDVKKTLKNPSPETARDQGHYAFKTPSHLRCILLTSDFTKSNYFQNRSFDATAAATGCTFDSTAAATGCTFDAAVATAAVTGRTVDATAVTAGRAFDATAAATG